MINRKLAGKIIVVRNDSRVRKQQKFVFVKIRTNVTGIIEEGEFETNEIINFYNSLYQSLIIPIIETEEKLLDLSDHRDFKITTNSNGRQVYGMFVDNPSGKINIEWILYNNTHVTNNFIRNLQALFLNDKDRHGKLKNGKYRNYFTIFSLGSEIKQAESYGMSDTNRIFNTNIQQWSATFRKNIILFKDRDEYTLNHEVLHGLGVYHIHREKDRDGNITEQKIIYPKKKYIYRHEVTTNVMAYNSNAYSTWRWQWHIINTNIKEK